ncbi:sugar kinase [Bacillus sp. E214]|uniref:sugar kinase n=1 Tax=Bacillus sp. E214 TaxID=2587156 RepID=UPI0011E06CAB|nr:sugar kinase [Bacillus sp. E214]
MKSIMLFGEMLLRLTPTNHQMLIQASQLDMIYGGSEANIAVALSHWGEKTSYATCLPDNNLGLAAVTQLRKYGVNTNHIVYKGKKMGLYFVEQGHSIRPTEVTYDRQNSAFVEALPNDYDFEAMLSEVKWLHVSGISLGASKNARETTMELVKAAKQKGIKISFDFNYRAKLWTLDEARKAYIEILPYIDVIIGSYLDVLTIRQEKREVNTFEEKIALLKEFQKEYQFDQIYTTERNILGNNVQELRCAIITETEHFTAGPVKVNVLDRIGTGDSFVAGVLYGINNQYSPQEIINFALSSFALKHTIIGDFQIASKADVQQFDVENEKVVIKR